MDKTPKPGTRRRVVFDMLVGRPGEWVDFDPQTLGYPSARCNALRSDLLSLRETYDLDIRAAGAGHPGVSVALRAAIMAASCRLMITDAERWFAVRSGIMSQLIFPLSVGGRSLFSAP